jgi:DNA-binding NarL/FixJ family response regulator
MVAEKIRLLLVDDHSMVRMGFTALLGLEKDLQVVAEAEDAAQAVQAFRQHRPDITLMDARMPGGSGVEALSRIRADFPDARIILLTTYDLEETVITALEAGAAGYLVKSIQQAELVAAIRQVHAGGQCFPASLRRRLAERGLHKRLTPREVETLDLLRRGLSNDHIGKALGLSKSTVKKHVAAIFLKLEVADRAEAVAAGFERGLLHIE